MIAVIAWCFRVEACEGLSVAVNVPKTSGIYRFVNFKNGKIYVGSAINLYRRRIDHIKELRAGKHRNSYLQRAWNKYGEENFCFEILELCEKEKLLELEQKWIDKLNCVKPNGYNLNPIAGSNLGRIFDDDFKLKASARQNGIKHSEETRKRMSEAHSNKKRDPSIGLKISEAKKGKGVGRKHTPEQLAKMKIAQMARREKEFEAGLITTLGYSKYVR